MQPLARYENTERRLSKVASKGLLYMGMGVSGGEEGARRGEHLCVCGGGGRVRGCKCVGQGWVATRQLQALTLHLSSTSISSSVMVATPLRDFHRGFIYIYASQLIVRFNACAPLPPPLSRRPLHDAWWQPGGVRAHQGHCGEGGGAGKDWYLCTPWTHLRAGSWYVLLTALLRHLPHNGLQVNDGPCVMYVGKGGSGNYVKMVHNGIEYGDMQLISEAYDMLRTLGGLTNEELAAVFREWNKSELESFLVEISAIILAKKDDQVGG